MWFKSDLRVTDHPGLHRLFFPATSTETAKSALFVMDPHVYKSVVDTREAAEALASAVASLEVALGRLGVRLEVRCGRWEEVVPEVVRALSATRVVYERECSGAFARGVECVMAGLDVEKDVWECLLFDGYDEDVEAFPIWKEKRVLSREAAAPLDAIQVDDGVAVDMEEVGAKPPTLTGEDIWCAIQACRNAATVHTDEASEVALFASSSEAHGRDCLDVRRRDSHPVRSPARPTLLTPFLRFALTSGIHSTRGGAICSSHAL